MRAGCHGSAGLPPGDPFGADFEEARRVGLMQAEGLAGVAQGVAMHAPSAAQDEGRCSQFVHRQVVEGGDRFAADFRGVTGAGCTPKGCWGCGWQER